MQVVRRLVGLDANQRRRNMIYGPEKFVELRVANRTWERRLKLREKMLPEGPAPSDQVFPHPRLRFVNAKRHIVARRQAELVGAQALVVDPMPGFVQHSEKGRVEEPLVVSRGNATVVRSQAGAKWMMRNIEPAAG